MLSLPVIYSRSGPWILMVYTLLPHTLRTPAWDPSAPRGPRTKSGLGLLAAAEELQHPQQQLVKQRMGGNGSVEKALLREGGESSLPLATSL